MKMFSDVFPNSVNISSNYNIFHRYNSERDSLAIYMISTTKDKVVIKLLAFKVNVVYFSYVVQLKVGKKNL